MKRRIWRQRILALLLTCVLLCQTVTIGTALEGEGADLISVDAPNADAGEAVSDLGVPDGSLGLACKSAILIEATTGAVLYKQNADEALPPASVTKIMTLLLVMEAIEDGAVRLDDTVCISKNAASMGGSQVFLKEGEGMTVEDLLKSVVIASANDAAVALAEYVAGSVPAFVEKMNKRAAQIGMSQTRFENATGLDDTAENHLTSARDIALMSKELIRHETILQYSSIWMDTIRNGEFGLTNTNRLVRFYRGCTGLKTGSTEKAGFCVSATAERDGFSLICVVMGAESRDQRNAIASGLLDWGFAGFGLYRENEESIEPVEVLAGQERACPVRRQAFAVVLEKAVLSKVERRVNLSQPLQAPIAKGDSVGSVGYYCDGKLIGTTLIVAEKEVGRLTFFDVLWRVFAAFLLI